MEIFYLVFAYVLGSIPFGYLITRFSTGKNILNIGWRKTSGSNVFKNIGKWQGILTGILDVLKGFLAVWFAQKLDFNYHVQILSGVAAVTGHNWSCFLNLAGGRGIGTFVGAFLAISPKILGFSLVPAIFLALIWNASIGTILLLIIALTLSFFPPIWVSLESQSIVGAFVLLSMMPIFLKRLSPLKEIKVSQNKWALIRNRFVFDNDQACFDLRIKRIFQRLTKK